MSELWKPLVSVKRFKGNCFSLLQSVDLQHPAPFYTAQSEAARFVEGQQPIGKEVAEPERHRIPVCEGFGERHFVIVHCQARHLRKIRPALRLSARYAQVEGSGTELKLLVFH